MPDEVPFTTGALRDWPLIEESIDRMLKEIADAVGTDLGEEYRQEVVDNVRRFYEAVNRHSISVTVALPPLPVSPVVEDEVRRNIEDALSRLVGWTHELTAEALNERILAAVEIVQLRRRLRKLGEQA